MTLETALGTAIHIVEHDGATLVAAHLRAAKEWILAAEKYCAFEWGTMTEDPGYFKIATTSPEYDEPERNFRHAFRAYRSAVAKEAPYHEGGST